MDYRQALDYIYSRLPMFQRIGPAAYKADLGNTIALCDALDHPYRGIPAIHVAGTNGKGSVSSLLAAVLQSAGCRTGLFTSPHLVDYRERIRIDGKMIPEEFVAGFISRNQDLFEQVKPSFFEVSFVMAAEWFRQEQVEAVVWETGMGGRLDSTNLITPLVSVITNISLDHAQFLGDTLKKIAAEKAGIIKPGVPVVIGEYQVECADVFVEKANLLGAELRFADSIRRISPGSLQPESGILDMSVVKGARTEFELLRCGLSGLYQLKNAATTLATIDLLREKFSIDDEAIRKGFLEVKELSGISGRWTLIAQNPASYCDTAHNPAGIAEVVGMLARIPHRILRIVLGMVDDKDISSVLKLLPREAEYFFCRASVPRAMDAARLMEAAAHHGLNGSVVEDCHSAYLKARAESEPDDLVFVGGSTFVVADVMAGIQKQL